MRVTCVFLMQVTLITRPNFLGPVSDDNWVNAAMIVFLKAAGMLRRRKRRPNESPAFQHHLPHPPPLSLCSAFTGRHSSAFVKDGFINRGGMAIAGRDGLRWLIPACLPASR